MLTMEKGFYLVNKPEGWTSFDVVGFLRKKIKTQNPAIKKIKVGHAGTLDPFATGLLVVAVGREATKRIEEFKNLPKTYDAVIHLGANSTTDDKTGEITEINNNQPSIQTIEEILKKFVGKHNQVPPMFSAKKINGTRLYKLARQGKEIKREPEEIEIFSLTILSYTYPKLEIKVSCSPGTYIRTLARDIGEKLGTGAYCEKLNRTKIGEYLLENAKTPDKTEVEA